MSNVSNDELDKALNEYLETDANYHQLFCGLVHKPGTGFFSGQSWTREALQKRFKEIDEAWEKLVEAHKK